VSKFALTGAVFSKPGRFYLQLPGSCTDVALTANTRARSSDVVKININLHLWLNPAVVNAIAYFNYIHPLDEFPFV
jgi:hypothetical protein